VDSSDGLDNCLNCGRRISDLPGPIFQAFDWFLGLFFLTKEERKDTREAKTKERNCFCGIPIYSDPKELKQTNDLFWISWVPFNSDYWSNTDSENRGLFRKTFEKYAFRIVNNIQRLDTIIQFKRSKNIILVQQDGRDISVRSDDSHATIEISNGYGVQHSYTINAGLRNKYFVAETKDPRDKYVKRNLIF
tara:strand:- start:23 stop:595 length:573 start_codon:yes stop_codon:yes gene_type:complete